MPETKTDKEKTVGWGLPHHFTKTTDKEKSVTTHTTDRLAEIANTVEWLIIALVLALFFRAFAMEAFRIPTGSMADTLKGAHFRLRCPQCGYQFDRGFIPERYGLVKDAIPHSRVELHPTRCPNCGYYLPRNLPAQVANGDRILVLKCFYQFLEPKRWDVVVFKDPRDPRTNFIKRLIGRPGEKVEIIDGDIYVDGKICRKPPKVQDELWMPVYNNDYQPVQPKAGSFNGHRWRQPFRNVDASGWKIDENDRTKIRLDSTTGRNNWLAYDTSLGNDFRAGYAYNDAGQYNRRPYCGDIMVRFFARSSGSFIKTGIELTKYNNRYRAWVNSGNEIVIAKVTADGEVKPLNRKSIEPYSVQTPILVKFANVDHRLIFQFGCQRLIYDFGLGPEDVGLERTNAEPQVKIFAAGELELSHIAIFRDIHYTAAGLANETGPARGTEGNPITLDKDEFFVLGDNSPNSQDSRWWNKPGVGNNSLFYRAGIVPRDYLVGKALCVYWPSGFRPFEKFPFSIVPNVGMMRLVYGGSDGGF